MAWVASIRVVKLNTRNCPSFLKPNPEGLKGFNGLQIWDHTRVWEKLSQAFMSWSPRHGIRAISPLSAWFTVVAGGQFDSRGFCPQTHSCHLYSFCIVFTLADLCGEVELQGIKSDEVFLQTAPGELHCRHYLVESSWDADINGVSHIQWSKRIQNIQGWRYLEIWFWRSKHTPHELSCRTILVLHSKK